MKTLTQDQVKNHTGFSIGDEIHLNDEVGTIVKVKNVQFVFKFGRADVWIDYEWWSEVSPMVRTDKGVSLENFRKIILG